MSELSLTLDSSSTDMLAELEGMAETVSYAEVAHGSVGLEGESLLQIARRVEDAKDILVRFAMAGFYVYRKTESSTRLVRDHTIGKLWHRVKEGDYSVNSEGLIYSYTPAPCPTPIPKLLVIFSSMSTSIYDTSMMRYFEQNFRSAQKYIPQDAGVLRIADIGGVVGAFYLNTYRNPDNVRRIQRLLSDVMIQYAVPTANVVLYGASKGGTAALFHGMTGGYKFISVDPIVSDDYYVHQFRDSHFTRGGIFERTKDEVFEELLSNKFQYTAFGSRNGAEGSVIFSERSPQYSAIASTLLKHLAHRVAFFNSINPGINDHPDVSPRTLNIATMLMNQFFLDEQLTPGLRTIV
ncbi:XcbB/CpsF family capsular polysaccharide biosynthesis protein [Arthrobacter sp. MDB2-24]